MNILFWNLKQNSNEQAIADIIVEQGIDIALFAEHLNTDFSKVCTMLHGKYTEYSGYGGCEKIILMSKVDYDITIKRESTRYILYSCNTTSKNYTLAGIHLPANPNSTPDDRKSVIRDIVQDVCELERTSKCDNTIIIGDFNASPFDSELIQKDAFNAVLYKGLINKAEYVTSNGKRYRRFYNPLVNYISEETQTYGSFYYSGGINSLYWYCYDQAIIRKPLVANLESIRYIKTIGGRKLIKEVSPDATISDHLPLVVEMKG